MAPTIESSPPRKPGSRKLDPFAGAFLVSVALTAALAAGPVAAQGFKPTRPVEIVVHTGPGGGADVMARALAAMFEQEKLLPVRVQVNNKTGGGGAVALAYLAEKKGEPHTIGIIGTGISITGPLVSKEARVTIRELTPIARLVLEPALIAVRRTRRSRSSSTRRRKIPGSSGNRPVRSAAATMWSGNSCRSTPARSGRISAFRVAASALPRCWVVMST
jgi:hypothetical protein